MAEAAGHRKIVGDEDHRQPQLLLQFPQQRQHLGLDLGIEHADAFIADQHLRLQGQGPGDGHSLLLAAGELAGKTILKLLSWIEANPLHQFPGPLAGGSFAAQAMDQQRVGNGIRHAEGRIEAGQRVLKHHLQGSSCLSQGLTLQAEQVLAQQVHTATADAVEPHQRPAKGALATA